jgi:hypothetical protein
VAAAGELTIHGVTNEVTIELQAELQGDAAVVVGSAPIALADHGIDPPTGCRCCPSPETARSSSSSSSRRARCGLRAASDQGESSLGGNASPRPVLSILSQR